MVSNIDKRSTGVNVLSAMPLYRATCFVDFTVVDGVAQWLDRLSIRPVNFPCPRHDVQLTGDFL